MTAAIPRVATRGQASDNEYRHFTARPSSPPHSLTSSPLLMNPRADNASLPENRLGDLARTVWRPAAGIGIVLVAVSLIIPALPDMTHETWEHFFRSYLFAFMFVLAICLGAMYWVMLQHAVKAGWSVVVRRIGEAVAGNLMWLWVLFIPIAVGMKMGLLYDWTHISGEEAEQAKYHYYLTPTFWLIRAAIFFLIWGLVSRFFVRTSIAQDATGEVTLTRRMERFAPICLILYALSQSYAAMDWVMSLDSAWFSTMFPVYFFAASCCGFFATFILLCFALQRMGRATHEITPEHYQDLGKLLFAFGIVFWAYIAFSQYMLIWYANIPEEVPFYLVRQMGGWLPVSILLLVGHFAAPFLAIISRHPKRRPQMLAVAAAWMLFMVAVDIYWLVKPNVPEKLLHDAPSYKAFAASVRPEDIGYGFSVLDVTCLLGLACLMIAGTFWRLGGASLIPERDPRLHESLAFENI